VWLAVNNFWGTYSVCAWVSEWFRVRELKTALWDILSSQERLTRQIQSVLARERVNVCVRERERDCMWVNVWMGVSGWLRSSICNTQHLIQCAGNTLKANSVWAARSMEHSAAIHHPWKADFKESWKHPTQPWKRGFSLVYCFSPSPACKGWMPGPAHAWTCSLCVDTWQSLPASTGNQGGTTFKSAFAPLAILNLDYSRHQTIGLEQNANHSTIMIKNIRGSEHYCCCKHSWFYWTSPKKDIVHHPRWHGCFSPDYRQPMIKRCSTALLLKVHQIAGGKF
jgi:hypothetical protein